MAVVVRHFLDSASPIVDTWLLLLSRKKLTSLYMQFNSTSPYVCSSSLFSFQASTNLVLAGCGLQVPPQAQFKGFTNLTVIDLVNVTTNKETIESLVNSSPLLQILDIQECMPIFSCLGINGPNLTSCTIKGKCKDITSGNTPKLMFIYINAWVNREIARCKLDRILRTILHSHLQEVRISHPFIENKKRPSTNFMDEVEKDINANMRAILIDWLVEFLSIEDFWGLSPFTCYLKHLRLEIDFEDSKQALTAFWLFILTSSLKTIFIFSVRGINKDAKDVANVQVLLLSDSISF